MDAPVRIFVRKHVENWVFNRPFFFLADGTCGLIQHMILLFLSGSRWGKGKEFWIEKIVKGPYAPSDKIKYVQFY